MTEITQAKIDEHERDFMDRESQKRLIDNLVKIIIRIDRLEQKLNKLNDKVMGFDD